MKLLAGSVSLFTMATLSRKGAFTKRLLHKLIITLVLPNLFCSICRFRSADTNVLNSEDGS